MKTGLALGKFAPLHKGHQALIETGIAETDTFVVLIYDAPEETSVPLTVRANWIRSIYPTVEVIEAWDGPTTIGNTPEIKSLHEDYILHILAGRRITHFYSSEFYGEHVSKVLGAVDRRFDSERLEFPISGTIIRNDLYRKRDQVDPIVYRDMITRAVFLGAPSTGKTRLSESAAKKYNTVCMPEYGREYWAKHQQNRKLTQEQLLEIAITHRKKEDELVQEANHYLFVDTDATTTRLFSHYYHGQCSDELEFLADETICRYDLFFLCDDDIPYDETWDRSGEVTRKVFQKKTRADLLCRRIPFVTLCGTLDERLQSVSNVLDSFKKWQSLPDHLILNQGHF